MATKTMEFTVAMTCEGCANAVKKVLGKIDDVQNVTTDVSTRKVTLKTTLSKEKIQEELVKTGKDVTFVCEKE